jgi:fumarylacetoacetate (FAA) hydrolase family protein
MASMRLTPENTLPAKGLDGIFIARVWVPGPPPGPLPAVVTPRGVFSLFDVAPTVAHLLEAEDPIGAVRRSAGERIGDVAVLLANTSVDGRDP